VQALAAQWNLPGLSAAMQSLLASRGVGQINDIAESRNLLLTVSIID
jgi:hypothetical protein